MSHSCIGFFFENKNHGISIVGIWYDHKLYYKQILKKCIIKNPCITNYCMCLRLPFHKDSSFFSEKPHDPYTVSPLPEGSSPRFLVGYPRHPRRGHSRLKRKQFLSHPICGKSKILPRMKGKLKDTHQMIIR